jgi:hypothetical protein
MTSQNIYLSSSDTLYMYLYIMLSTLSMLSIYIHACNYIKYTYISYTYIYDYVWA